MSDNSISAFFREAIKTEPNDQKVLIAAMKHFGWSLEDTVKRATYPKYYRSEIKRKMNTRNKLMEELKAELAKV